MDYWTQENRRYVPMAQSRWEVKIGSPVMATDGECGCLQRLVLDPHQERIVALLVQQRGMAISHTVVVPEEEVAEATDNEVRLKISRDQMDLLPEYKPERPLIVKDRWYQADKESYAVRGLQGMELGRSPTAQHPGML